MEIEKSSRTVFTPLEGGKGVLLNLETLLYYSLNRTGSHVWRHIEGSERVTIDELVRATCNEFDVDEQGARQAIAPFVQRLQELKMVRVL